MRGLSLLAAILLAFPNPASCRQLPSSSSASSTQATMLLQQSVGALVGNTSVSDVTLAGSARRIASSDDESGTATLEALQTGEARVDLNFSGGLFSEVVSKSPTCAAGTRSGRNGTSHPLANHNLYTDSSWFFPALTVNRVLPFSAINPVVQQTTPQTTQVVRDAQALTILSQTLSSAGGASAIAAIQDYTGSGTITYYWDPQVSGNATVQGRGHGQFRIDATLQDGVRTVVVNNGTGSITETDGSTTLIPPEAATILGSMTFPYTTLVAAVQDSSVMITYVGLVDHGGSPFHDVRLQKIYPLSSDSTGAKSALSVRDFFIDPNTFLIASVLNIAGQRADGNRVFREVVFASYQTVGGVAVPFQITEKIHDQPLVALQLSQINFNTGLTDSSFTK